MLCKSREEISTISFKLILKKFLDFKETEKSLRDPVVFQTSRMETVADGFIKTDNKDALENLLKLFTLDITELQHMAIKYDAKKSLSHLLSLQKPTYAVLNTAIIFKRCVDEVSAVSLVTDENHVYYAAKSKDLSVFKNVLGKFDSDVTETVKKTIFTQSTDEIIDAYLSFPKTKFDETLSKAAFDSRSVKALDFLQKKGAKFNKEWLPILITEKNEQLVDIFIRGGILADLRPVLLSIADTAAVPTIRAKIAGSLLIASDTDAAKEALVSMGGGAAAGESKSS